MGLPIGNYKAVIDLKADNVLVTNARMKRHWYKLCDLAIEKDTKKARKNVARTVKQYCQKEKIVCKTTLVKLFGKTIADLAPVWKYADNPYYKCSASMQLYFKRSIEYLYGNLK